MQRARANHQLAAATAVGGIALISLYALLAIAVFVSGRTHSGTPTWLIALPTAGLAASLALAWTLARPARPRPEAPE